MISHRPMQCHTGSHLQVPGLDPAMFLEGRLWRLKPDKAGEELPWGLKMWYTGTPTIAIGKMVTYGDQPRDFGDFWGIHFQTSMDRGQSLRFVGLRAPGASDC